MKTLVGRLLAVLLIGLVGACGPQKPKVEADMRDNFVGEWKSADTNAQTHTRIKRTGDTFYIHEGINDLVGTYDPNVESIMIDNGVKKVPVKYLPETDQLLITGGQREAKFSRVK
ncbi:MULTISPECIES: hypothetical protein [Hymenobacter]|uniref:Uncharacterized protein n=1 Tax=Hymenobacter armeniacus TaxID=2771358 RepID=A0ABR8JRR8_9BACT|nr:MULTISPECIES: hypothetical protein [Hymenobacter]MBD2721473.1 hypothetical protein [Hymenobacter armeniacus]MBJ6111011.1 hypothetical protein [Hymenobacter sp. BT523]